jgi:hypothetical protein
MRGRRSRVDARLEIIPRSRIAFQRQLVDWCAASLIQARRSVAAGVNARATVWAKRR